MKALDLTGQRFGRLIAERRDTTRPIGLAWWICRCDCGNTTVVLTTRLRQGGTKSCGCFQRDQRFTHHAAHHPLYWVWAQMIARCTKPTHRMFRLYGARGIQVCERWRDFGLFLADMGERPSRKHSIDRINNDGNYEPANVRWATQLQQSHNSRKLRWLSANGVRAHLAAWAVRLQLPSHTLRYWLKKKSLQQLLAPDRFAKV